MTRRHDSRVLIIALALPIALAAVGLGIVLAWLPQLPSTVAVHWGAGGPDGFTLRSTLPVALGFFSFGIPLLLGGIVVLSKRTTFGFGHKLLATMSLATTVLLLVVFVGATAVQRGLVDSHRAPAIGPSLAIGFAAAAIVGLGAWFVLPKWSHPDPGWRAAAPLPLAAQERAVWLGTARLPVWMIALVLIPTALISVIASRLAADHGGFAWLLFGIPVLLLVVVLGFTDWRVRVDAAGLRVRSLVGFPRWTIPFGEIAEAGTTSVEPLAEFGGWGLRWAGRGRVGIITRRGPALEVRRRDGGSLVVTVDDAEAAAALLTARVAAR